MHKHVVVNALIKKNDPSSNSIVIILWVVFYEVLISISILKEKF